MFRTVCAATVMTNLLIASSASSQCTVYRLGMPDFDQRRSTLPNEGRMYCLPTATLNAFAYMTNHGMPGVISGGPRDWSSQSEYPLTSTRLFALGLMMGTDPESGTSLDDWLPATRNYLESSGVAPFVNVSFLRATTLGALDPRWLAYAMRAGSIVLPVWGWYEQVAVDPLFSRTGGHMVTMTLGLNTCGGLEDFLLGYRDPANDRELEAQGPFTTTFTGLHMVPGARFARGSETTFTERLIARADIYRAGPGATSGFLEAYASITPLAGLIVPPGTGDLEFTMPKPFSSEPEPKRFRLPSGGMFLESAAMDLHPGQAFVVMNSRLAINPHRLYQVNMLTGERTEIDRYRLLRGADVVVGRDGSVYTPTSSRRINRYSRLLDEYVPSGEISLDRSIDAMLFDDATDELVVLSVADRRLIRIETGRDLRVAKDNLIPAVIPLAGDGSVAINPIDGKEWVAGSDSPTITRLQRDAAGRILPEALVTLPGVTAPRSLQFGDDGTLYVVQSRTVMAFEPDGTGGWRRSASPLDGVRTEGFLKVSRGRDNRDPSFAGPDDINLLPPDLGLGARDCPADVNLDGRLDFFDFLAFQDLFTRGSTYADFDHDGQLTFFDFLAFQNAFAAGCP